MDLGQIRTSIDQVDQDLVELLNRRFDLVDKVGLYKYIEGLEIENKDRESNIKDRLISDYGLKDEAILDIFEEIFAVSKARQSKNFASYKELQEECKKKKENIILVGMPGSGKTTIGKKLAYFLNRDFIDIDEVIYKENKSKPGEIIEKYGESHFRSLESDALKRVLKEQGKVIATGGGILTKDENLTYIKNPTNIVYYIDRNLEDLAIDGRPLSQGGPQVLIDLYNKRNIRYETVCDLKIFNEDIYDTIYTIAKHYLTI